MTARANRIRRNLFELNASLGVRAVARVVSAVLLVDRLGMASYGKMAWALTLTYVSVGDDLGLGNWAMRAAAREPAWYRKSTTGFIAVSAGIAAVRIGLLVLFLPLVCPDVETRGLATMFAAASLVNVFALGWLHFARERMATLRNVAIFRELSWLAGVILLVHSPADLHRLPILFLCCELASTAIVNATAFMAEGLPDLELRIPSIRELFGGALPIWVGGRVYHLRAQLGTLVIGALEGSSAVAVFDLAWRVAYNIWLLGATSLGAVTPALLMRAPDAGQAFWVLLRRSLRIAYVCALLAPVLALPALRPLLVLVLGGKGLPVALPLQLLLVMTLPAILRGLMRYALFALGKNQTLGILAVVDIAMLGVAIFAARLGGVVGLAGALAGIEMLLAFATGWALFTRALPGALSAAWPAALAAAAACLAAFAAVGLGAIPSVIAGAGVYVVAIWFLEPVSRVALDLLRGATLPPSSSS